MWNYTCPHVKFCIFTNGILYFQIWNSDFQIWNPVFSKVKIDQVKCEVLPFHLWHSSYSNLKIFLFHLWNSTYSNMEFGIFECDDLPFHMWNSTFSHVFFVFSNVRLCILKCKLLHNQMTNSTFLYIKFNLFKCQNLGHQIQILHFRMRLQCAASTHLHPKCAFLARSCSYKVIVCSQRTHIQNVRVWRTVAATRL